MSPLIRYIITRMSIGFALGASTAMALVVFTPEAIGSPSGPLEICMIIYGLGSTFAAGYLATALATGSDIRPGP
ncbi:hypothetical protein [Mesorhizobium sp. KR9-304]|uniref:hypothetical protein n=1 Tax=Mesorhizobium sp. KR9-304 TaxID=3156614 RepID=UPI0032B60E59